jgi:hypothetical protein
MANWTNLYTGITDLAATIQALNMLMLLAESMFAYFTFKRVLLAQPFSANGTWLNVVIA